MAPIRGDGFSGIAAIAWAAGCPKLMLFKSKGGRHLPDMLVRSGPIVIQVIYFVAHASVRGYCNGHTIP